MKRFFFPNATLCGPKAILSHESLSRCKEPARYFTVQLGFGIDSAATVEALDDDRFAWQAVLAGCWHTANSADKMTQRIVRGARICRLMESPPYRRRPRAERDSRGKPRAAAGTQAGWTDMFALHRENPESRRRRAEGRTLQCPMTLSSSTGMSAHKARHVHGWIRMKHRQFRHSVRPHSWPRLPENLHGAGPI